VGELTEFFLAMPSPGKRTDLTFQDFFDEHDRKLIWIFEQDAGKILLQKIL
jgi:hypothetical protein